jgi:hypothetical protein
VIAIDHHDPSAGTIAVAGDRDVLDPGLLDATGFAREAERWVIELHPRRADRALGSE